MSDIRCKGAWSRARLAEGSWIPSPTVDSEKVRCDRSQCPLWTKAGLGRTARLWRRAPPTRIHALRGHADVLDIEVIEPTRRQQLVPAHAPR